MECSFRLESTKKLEAANQATQAAIDAYGYDSQQVRDALRYALSVQAEDLILLGKMNQGSASLELGLGVRYRVARLYPDGSNSCCLLEDASAPFSSFTEAAVFADGWRRSELFVYIIAEASDAVDRVVAEQSFGGSPS